MDPWSNTATDTGNYPYLSFFLFLSLSIFLCHSVSLFLIISHYLIIQQDSIFSRFLSIHEKNRNEKPNKEKNRPRIQEVQVARPHESHTVLLNVYETLRTLSFSFPLIFSFLLTVRERPFDVRTHVERTRARVFLFITIKYVYRI